MWKVCVNRIHNNIMYAVMNYIVCSELTPCHVILQYIIYIYIHVRSAICVWYFYYNNIIIMLPVMCTV